VTNRELLDEAIRKRKYQRWLMENYKGHHREATIVVHAAEATLAEIEQKYIEAPKTLEMLTNRIDLLRNKVAGVKTPEQQRAALQREIAALEAEE